MISIQINFKNVLIHLLQFQRLVFCNLLFFIENMTYSLNIIYRVNTQWLYNWPIGNHVRFVR